MRLSQVLYAATPTSRVEPTDGTVACTSGAESAPTVADAGAPLLVAERAVPGLPAVPLDRCPSGMRLVDGMYCPHAVHECLDYLSVERDRCQQYGSNTHCIGALVPMQFCVDEFEFPNRRGVKPTVWVNFQQAIEHCSSANKRLCTGSEWELACEGPDRLPYTTGYRRDPSRCNYDRPNIVADHDALANPTLRDAEFARIDQREPSGAREECVSYYGVYDMNGNVDEWVLNEGGSYTKAPFRSGLKGGYWGRVRNRCRPTTTDHNAWHSDYQVGFRCCADAAAAFAMKR